MIVWSAALGGVLALDDPRLRFWAFLAFISVAGAVWGWFWFRGLHARWVAIAAILAVAVRIAFVLTPPAMSDDVFRYVYEGRVVWTMGPAFPFTHAPIDALKDGVPPALLDASWLRINHPALATIYPPFAQTIFAAAFGRLLILKLLLVLAELGAYAVIWKKTSLERAVVLALCPLAAFELAREAHADALSMLGLAIGAAAFHAARPRAGYAGFFLAALAKLNGLIAVLPAVFATRRGLWIAAPMMLVLALPYAIAGGGEQAALFAYAGSWRSGDGAFAVLHALAELVLGGDWRRVSDDWTLTRDQLARAFSALIFAGYAGFLLRRKPAVEEVPERAAALLLMLLLLSPVLHPWYTLWLLPFLPFAPRLAPAIAAALILAPLLHHATWLELVSGRWRELGLLRALVHVPVWALFGYARFACPSKKRS